MDLVVQVEDLPLYLLFQLQALFRRKHENIIVVRVKHLMALDVASCSI